MLDIYEDLGVHAIHFPIKDMDVIDMSSKLYQISELIHLLITKYHVSLFF